MFFQEYRFCPPPCRSRTDGRAPSDVAAVAAPEFHSSATRTRSSTPRNLTVCGSLRVVLTDVLSAGPGPHVTQRTICTDLRPGRCAASLESAIVQPDTASDDDRGCIIDAAYGCLSEPHTGPIPVAAILQRAGVSTRAFYRHFESKDELFLAMLRQESDALADRLDRIADEAPGAPVDQLKAWIDEMFGLDARRGAADASHGDRLR